MDARTGKKKYTRTIYVITPAESPMNGLEDLESTLGVMNSLEITLNVIGVDFLCHSTRSAVKRLPGVKQEAELATVTKTELGTGEGTCMETC